MSVITAAINQKIKQLQRAEDKIKKRWLIGLSASSAVIIILLWLGYANLAIPAVGGGAKAAGETAPADKKSFFSTFSRGFEVVTDDLKSKLEEIISSFRSLNRSNEFNIKSDTQNAEQR